MKPRAAALSVFWGGKWIPVQQVAAVASSPGHSQVFSWAVEKNREKAWDQNYVTDRKWWTRLVRNVTRFVLTESTVSGPWRSFDPRPSPDFSPRLRDKIWEWPGNEAMAAAVIPSLSSRMGCGHTRQSALVHVIYPTPPPLPLTPLPPSLSHSLCPISFCSYYWRPWYERCNTSRCPVLMTASTRCLPAPS